MATQGIVSVVKNKQVRLKIIVGCDGYNARNLARMIRRFGKIPGLTKAYEMAVKAKFGDSECRVVMGEKTSRHFTGGRLSPLYRQTFNQPRFNPRWKQGIAGHTCVVNVRG